jgi:HD-GYP domain-containing protein (c-di-GMP phosphodiesterase class II)
MMKHQYSEKTLEGVLFGICVALTVLLYFVVGFKMVVLNLFYLPVVLAAFYLGRHRAGILALLCVIFASVVAVLDLEAFAATTSPLVIGLALTVWAAVMGLNAIFVGTLSDERNRKMDELHDAYLGVVEVLSRYLKSADPAMKDRSKRVSELSQLVGRQMRLSDREVDDIRIAALLQDIDNIEITAKVIHRAVGDLRRANTSDAHTFHGSDLVHSLGSVLTGALPLIMNQTEGMATNFEDEERKPKELPFGARIIETVSRYDALVHGASEATPEEAITMLRSDLDADHHPAVVHALEQVILAAPSIVNDRIRSIENLVGMGQA